MANLTINEGNRIKIKDSSKRITKIFGGPGCGKTTYVLGVLDDLLKKTSADNIAFISFTNKGVNSGAWRAREKYNLNYDDTPYWGTIHSLCNKFACKNSGRIITNDDYKNFSAALKLKFLGHFTEELNHGDDIYLFMEQLSRVNTLKHLNSLSNIPDMNKYEWIKDNYKNFKMIYSIYDFTDMLEIYLKKDEPLPIKYMIIDEAQDLSPLQWRVIELMSRNCEDIFLAGDDDQAIYEWCGGDTSIFNEIISKEEIILNKSYRISETIKMVSQNIVKRIDNNNRVNKNIVTSRRVRGYMEIYNNFEDIRLKSEEYYILSRNRVYLNSIKLELMRRKLPFTYMGNVYPRTLKGNKKNRVSDQEYGYTVGMKYNKNYKRGEDEKRIVVDTIHRVKGGETHNVILLMKCTPAVEKNMLECPDEELRVLYVATTRARNALHIVCDDQGESRYRAFAAREFLQIGRKSTEKILDRR